MTGLIHILSAVATISGNAPPTDIPVLRRFPPGIELAQAATPLQIPQDAAPPATTTSPAPVPDATAPVPAPAAGTQTGDQPAGEPQGEDLTEPDPNQPDANQDDGASPDDLSLGEIPTIETMELTPDIAKRALDSYLAAKDKYADSDMESYENLQDFVDQTPEGKNFEADVKAAGFTNVTEWNLAITTLGVIYSSVTEDQTPDLLQQIKEVEDDKELAQDIKDRMIKALKAMIPSDNNKKVVEDLLADPAYGPKLKQLDVEEE